MSTPKRKRVILDFVERENIRNLIKNKQHIADVFTTKWDLPINCRTVRDILKELGDLSDMELYPRKRLGAQCQRVIIYSYLFPIIPIIPYSYSPFHINHIL